jgi:hypothetical protein
MMFSSEKGQLGSSTGFFSLAVSRNDSAWPCAVPDEHHEPSRPARSVLSLANNNGLERIGVLFCSSPIVPSRLNQPIFSRVVEHLISTPHFKLPIQID